MITRVRGTQDIYDVRLFNYVFKTVRAFLNTYNFHEIATPIIEHVELFQRSLGVETDVVSKEMFIIEPHAQADNTEKLCLRPEGTASIMRAFLELGGMQSVPTPWKAFLCGPMFRHERPQKGRYRQFNHCSVEMLGTAAWWHDLEMIMLFDRLFLHIFELTGYVLQINFLGCKQDREKYKQTFLTFVETHQEKICQTCKQRKEKNILRMLDCKNESCKTVYATAPHCTDVLCDQCATEWSSLQRFLNVFSVTFSHNPYLVRGLDYYDKTVFEFIWPQLGAQSTFCAGGRYNGLAEQLGSKNSVPSIGAALGIDRFVLLLQEINYQIPEKENVVHVCMPLDETQYVTALCITDQLRLAGHTVELFLDGASLKKMLQKADKMQAFTALIIGSEEQHTNMVTIKNLRTGETKKVPQAALLDYYNAIDTYSSE